jgi:hypothetical protein
MDVCLTNYGHCNYVSGKHACIFYDEVRGEDEMGGSFPNWRPLPGFESLFSALVGRRGRVWGCLLFFPPCHSWSLSMKCERTFCHGYMANCLQKQVSLFY